MMKIRYILIFWIAAVLLFHTVSAAKLKKRIRTLQEELEAEEREEKRDELC